MKTQGGGGGGEQKQWKPINQPQNEWYTLTYTSKLSHYTDEEVSTFCVCVCV